MTVTSPRRPGRIDATVRSPWDDSEAGVHALASEEEMHAAVSANVAAAEACRSMPAWERAACLRRIADALEQRSGEFALMLAREAGKPVTLGKLEIERAVFVLRDGAEEATRITGETIPLDVMPAGKGRLALTRRFPVSPIAAITPFNFPVLLAAHKIAPAMACGAAMTLKPPPQDPLTTLMLGEIVAQSGYPAGGMNVVPCDLEVARRLVADPRIRMITFTGSAKAGWDIRSRAGTRRVALELGGNAAVIVAADADLEFAARRCAAGGYAFAGQSCISAQRILVERAVYAAFLERFIVEVKALKVGDPLDEATLVGPMIDEASAKRAESWIREAVAEGAKVETGGTRRGSVLEPTILTGTKPAQKVNCEEIFAPVTTVTPCAGFAEAIALANDSPYGLQAGVFTRDNARLMEAWSRLDVGGVIGNDIPGYRIDRMPYGGAKASGLGREGVRYAIDEMTEVRLLILPGA
jgi:acyl-CoA reductase-like NAD-dependent aldehyde dehydrogenase